jgi:hypothetical protein
MESPMAPENEQQHLPENKIRTPANEGTYAPPPIAGYRSLSEDEVVFINTVKSHGEQIGAVIEALERRPEIDKRWLAIAKTDLQKGMMALVRSIAKPTNF